MRAPCAYCGLWLAYTARRMHQRACARKRPWERDYYCERGRWPRASRSTRASVGLSRSQQRGNAARKTGHSYFGAT